MAARNKHNVVLLSLVAKGSSVTIVAIFRHSEHGTPVLGNLT